MFPRDYFARWYFSKWYWPSFDNRFGGAFKFRRRRRTGLERIVTKQPINWKEPLNAGTVGWWLAHPQYTGTNRLVDLTQPGDINRGTLINVTGGYTSTTMGWQRGGGRPGSFGTYLRLSGATGYTSVPHRPEFNVNRHTVMAWFRTTASGKFLLTKDSDSFFLGVGTAGPTNTFQYYTLGTSYGGWLSGSATVNDGVWHHGAGVYDGANMLVYVDGRLDGSVASTGMVSTGTSPIGIGVRTGYGLIWDGDIDDVRIINRPLSAGEIMSLYLESRQFYPRCLRVERETSAFAGGVAPPTEGGGGSFFPFLQAVGS